jgi:membrane associated rhomboid family serine protease
VPVVFLLVVVSLALYVMTPEERLRLLTLAKAIVRRAIEVGVHHWKKREPYDDALAERTRLLLITPAIAVANVGIFLGLLFGDGTLSSPETLVAWGANFGPRTTNGEWWRLLTAAFVHGGLLSLLINVVAVAQIGTIVERLIGHAAFAAVYLSACFFASLMAVATSPENVSAGAAGAVFGLFGLLVASFVRGLLQPSTLSIPLKTMVRLAPAAGLFMLYNAATGGFDLAAKAGLFTGFVFGMVVTRDIREQKPTVQRLAISAAATFVIAIIAIVPLRSVTDIRPELELLVSLEQRTTAAYEDAVLRFRNGRITTKSLASLIDGTILPELQAARARVTALQRVPPAHQPLVTVANDYLKLRDESWRLRAEALSKANMRLLREADRTERASLVVFEQLKTGTAAVLSKT